MFSVLNTHTQGQEEAFGGDGLVHGIDCEGGFIGIYLSPNSSIRIH